ncbi:MAG TPA: HAD family hydrolase [Urbifossiella sp.]|nr:HAD family hydrolase [Urbifossiella sp.]
MSAFEIVNPNVRRGPYRAALFDFDGTLSLIREGWPRVMIGMMVGILRERKLAPEPEEQLWGLIERFVMALNGHPTIAQMERFAEEIASRGGTPDAPTVYLQDYLDRLMAVVQQRWDLLASGAASAGAWVVPDAHAILRRLQSEGMPLFLASGTDLEAVLHEGHLLKVLSFFGEHVYAPAGGNPTFTKGHIVDGILASLAIRGEELLAFGDGVVETQEVKRVGGTFVGVASAEPGQSGVNADKRTRLIAAGADIIIPEYRDHQALFEWLQPV